MKLSEKIISLRKARSMTQDELATQANITLRTVQRIEKDETMPRGFTLKSIAKALGVAVEDLNTLVTPSAIDSSPFNPDRTRTILQYMNLASFGYLVIPFGNIIFPLIIWRRQIENPEVYQVGKKIMSYHIYWSIVTHAGLFILLSLTLVGKMYLGFSAGRGILPLFLLMYLINIPLILYASLRLKKGYTNPYPGQRPAIW